MKYKLILKKVTFLTGIVYSALSAKNVAQNRPKQIFASNVKFLSPNTFVKYAVFTVAVKITFTVENATYVIPVAGKITFTAINASLVCF